MRDRNEMLGKGGDVSITLLHGELSLLVACAQVK